MNDPICYKAFGLVLESEFPIVQLPVVEGREPDVRIVRADLSGLPLQRGIYSGPDCCYFGGQDLCIHRIAGRNRIEVEPREDYDPSKQGIYLMGTCMGAIHYQRGPLGLVVRLLPHEDACNIRPLEGMTKVEQLLDRRGGLRRKDVRADHRPHGRSLPKRCQRIASKSLLSC